MKPLRIFDSDFFCDSCKLLNRRCAATLKKEMTATDHVTQVLAKAFANVLQSDRGALEALRLVSEELPVSGSDDDTSTTGCSTKSRRRKKSSSFSYSSPSSDSE